MSVYTADPAISSGNLVQSEVHLYGSSRVGIFEIKRNVQTLATSNYLNNINTFVRGNKFFELSNHLQNVLVVVSDKKIAVDSDGNGTVDYYNADVVTANDYYPFGMAMPGRKFTQPNSSYRYGFNGQEKSDDVTVGNFTAEYWEYDSRIGRRWNVDPVPNEAISPYATNNNNPIVCTDPDGDFPIIGFIIGFVADIAMQAVVNVANGKKPFEDISLTSAFISGIAGALTGGLSSFTGTMTKGIVRTAVQSAGEVAILTTESVAKQTLVQNKEASLEQTFSDVGSDLAGGFLFKKVLGDGLDASAAINTKNANLAQGEATKMMSGEVKVGTFQGASYANTKGLNQIAKTEKAGAKLKTVTSEAISEVSRNTTQESSNIVRTEVKKKINSNNTQNKTNKPKVPTKTKSSTLKFITRTRSDGAMISVPDNEYGRKGIKEFMKGKN